MKVVRPLHLGIDLGGTNIKTVVLDESYRVLGENSVPTGAVDGPDAVISNIIAAGLAAMVEHPGVVSCGLGVPGWFDSVKGTIEHFANIEGD